MGMLELGMDVPTGTAKAVVHPYFKRELKGLLRASVDWSGQYRPIPTRPSQASARAGLRYERLVLRGLAAAFPGTFISHLPFSFQTAAKRGWAIPDGLLFDFDRKVVLLCEIKLSHSGDAWYQLYKFYLPIVQEALPVFRVVPVEICRTYDPWVKLPKPVSLLTRLSDAFEACRGHHLVLATRLGDCGESQFSQHAESSPQQTGNLVHQR